MFFNSNRFGKMFYVQNAVQLELDNNKCTGCGICLDVCPHGVFAYQSPVSNASAQDNKKKAVIQHKKYCMECGACAKNCPAAAITAGRGVGCAEAIITGWWRKSEPVCGCSDSQQKNGCCG